MEIRINLNERVKFKLSERGKEIYRHRYDGYGFEYNREPELDDDGYMSMQLWMFMQIFGEHMVMGMSEVLKPLEIIYEKREQIGEWVRCEDRLPDEIGTYLVSGKMKYDTDKEHEYFVDIADYTKVEHCDYMGKFGGFFQTCNDWYEGQQEYEILAWKPLPEPYEENK